MAKIEKFLPQLLKHEGGFVNHPKDPGGATNKGITLNTYRMFYGKHKTVSDLKNISPSEVEHIYQVGYWDKMQAHAINNQSVANLMVDWLVNSGVGKIKNIQRTLSVFPDGIVGNETLSTINKYSNQEELFQKVWDARKSYYDLIIRSNPKLEVFKKGWMKRLNDYKYEA